MLNFLSKSNTHLTQSTSEPQITQITQITQIFSRCPNRGAEVGLIRVICVICGQIGWVVRKVSQILKNLCITVTVTAPMWEQDNQGGKPGLEVLAALTG